MRVYVEHRHSRNERVILATMRDTARRGGHQVVSLAEKADAAIVWGWSPKVEGQPTLHVEQGWLPRWTWQVSHRGLNGESHIRRRPRVLRDSDSRLVRMMLEALRSYRCDGELAGLFGYADPTGPPARDVPEEFVLVPMQVEADHNLALSEFSSMQELVDVVSEADPPWPVVFRAHPARCAHEQRVEVRRAGDVERRHDGATVHAYLKHPGCKAVVLINSNVAHDALLWDVPVVALGRGVWPSWSSGGPFFDELPETDEEWWQMAALRGGNRRLDYAAHVLRSQWDLYRAAVPREVDRALELACR